MNNGDEILAELTEKQRLFCKEYIIDWNATRAAIAAGYSEKTARFTGHENLTKPNIQAFIQAERQKLEENSGLSALRNLLELKKLAFSSIADFKENWHTAKDFDELTEDQKAALSEISVTTRTEKSKDGNGSAQVETIKIKTHDKLKAIEMINKMLGYNAPDKVDHTAGGEPLKITVNID